MKNIEVYRAPAEAAEAKNELDKYRESFRANVACKEAIEAAISRHYANNCLDTDACMAEVVEAFGIQRVVYVLANTVQRKSWDGRFTQRNKTWAAQYPIHPDPGYGGGDRRNRFVVDKVNPGLVDMLVTKVRWVYCESGKVLRGASHG